MISKRTMVMAVLAVLVLPMIGMGAITLTVNTTYQQTTNNPCVIGDQSCNQPAGFIYSAFSGTPGTGGVYDLFSPRPNNTGDGSSNGNGTIAPAYTASQITNLVGTSFLVGIDDNNASGQGAENLVFFKMFVNGALVASYAGPTAISNKNGNGFSDAVLNGFTLAGVAAGASVYFEASMSNDTDGMEEFFLINTSSPIISNPPPAIPEPASVVFLGTGLLGTALVFRRKWNRNHQA